jgi:hypothetical protein
VCQVTRCTSASAWGVEAGRWKSAAELRLESSGSSATRAAARVSVASPVRLKVPCIQWKDYCVNPSCPLPVWCCTTWQMCHSVDTVLLHPHQNAALECSNSSQLRLTAQLSR